MFDLGDQRILKLFLCYDISQMTWP